MGPPRAARRKAVTISSDDEDESASQAIPSQPSEDEQSLQPQKRTPSKPKAKRGPNGASRSDPVNLAQDGDSQKSPAKGKLTAPKKKTTGKELPKSNARPIYSFFNAATQRQRVSQPSASPEKLSTPQEEPEAILDDSEDSQISGVRLDKGSSTALALRKRKLRNGESFEDEVGTSLSASQKFRKTSSGDRIPSLSIINEDKRPWTDQFAPNDLSELAVHKRKVADVRQWLELSLRGRRQKALVLKGAAGNGKTTTVRLLAQALGLQVLEWKNPAGAELTAEGSTSTAAQFNEFILRAGRSGGLEFSATSKSDDIKVDTHDNASTNQPQLLLVEEFPNTFSRASAALQSFRSAILQYLSVPLLPEAQPTPLILIISETLLSTNTALADSFTAHRLLGPELTNHPFLDVIEFNAVAVTFLTKALEAIVLKEARKSGRRKTPGPLVLKRLAESGDIRSAVSSLEFLCLRGDEGDVWSSKVIFTKSKKAKSEPPLTEAEREALKLVSNRESTLGIFHAVGKVVYNKRVRSPAAVQPPHWLPQHRRLMVPENNADDLIDELGTDTSTFVAALHENYALSCSGSTTEETLDSLLGCLDSISEADLLSADRFSYGTRAFSGSTTDGLRQDEMSFQVAVRGLLFSLPFPVHRTIATDGKRADAHRMYYPSSLKLWRKREEIEGALDLLATKIQAGDLDISSSASRKQAAAGPSGVETWKQQSSEKFQATELDKIDSSVVISSRAKTEVLLERLPYTTQISLSSRKASTKLVELMSKVTHIESSSSVVEDEEADTDDENGNVELDQQTTDRPDVDVQSKKTITKPQPTQQGSKGRIKGTSSLPVENQIGKLVLEEDDIVDD